MFITAFNSSFITAFNFSVKTCCLVMLLIVSLCGFTHSYADNEVSVQNIAQGLTSPWAMAFLPNGDMLVTERAGKLRLVQDGQLREQAISGLPAVYQAGQGGLMDVVLDAQFATNQKIYLSYAHGSAKRNALRLASARLLDNRLVDFTVLFTGTYRATAHHYGARIAQLSDGTLILTSGDGYNYREDAQRLDNYHGKIIRIDQQGKAPSDNPFVDNADALPEIYSYGHRNQQGLVISDGDLIISHEHGPRGGDEMNRIQPSLNYGWPVITQGIDYNGARISPYTVYKGMQQPGVDWTPSIAPSSMLQVTGELFRSWQGSYLVSSLAEQSIRRVTYVDGQFIDHGLVLTQIGGDMRYRDIKMGNAGAIYVLTDGTPAHIIKVLPQVKALPAP